MNDAPTVILLVSLLVLLVIIAFSSGTEVAMLSVNRYRIRTRAQNGESSAKTARLPAAIWELTSPMIARAMSNTSGLIFIH